MRYLALTLNLVLSLIVCNFAWAQPIEDDKAILSIIGEAENQGLKGMKAVAHAIRNRGTLRGVCGFKNPRVVEDKFSMAIYQKASRAWHESEVEEDFTGGADHWENVEEFGRSILGRFMRRDVQT